MDLYVHETGAVDGPAIVFLHGGGLSGRMWQPQLEQLAEYHCLVPDLPEQGQSAGVGPFTLDNSAQQVAELISTHSSGRANVVGLSLGGAVALTLLRTAPERVDHVIVSGTAAGLGRVLGAISKASARLYRYMSPETLIKLSIRQFGIPPEYQAAFRDDLRQGASEAFTQRYTDALMAMRLPTNVTAPVLVSVGERETMAAKQAARKLVSMISGAQGVIAPQAGHVWNLQKPDLFTEMLRAWFEDRELPAMLKPFR